MIPQHHRMRETGTINRIDRTREVEDDTTFQRYNHPPTTDDSDVDETIRTVIRRGGGMISSTPFQDSYHSIAHPTDSYHRSNTSHTNHNHNHNNNNNRTTISFRSNTTTTTTTAAMNATTTTTIPSSSSSPPPHRRNSTTMTNTTTPTTRRRYQYLQIIIVIFIVIATIFNIYTSSVYLLKQRMLSSSSSFHSNPLYLFPPPTQQQQQQQQKYKRSNHPKNSSSFLRLPSTSSSLSSRNQTQHDTNNNNNNNSDSENENDHNNEWVLPIATIEHLIRQSSDFQRTHQRRLVVCATNEEYLDFADNFIHHLRHSQQMTNFVIVPLDVESYQTLHRIYPNHTLPTFPMPIILSTDDTTTSTLPLLQQNEHHNDDANDDKNDAKDDKTATTTDTTNPKNHFEFGSTAFRQLTASRPNFLRQILQQLHNVTIFYNDIDMVWKSNAWQVLDERIQLVQETSMETLIQDEMESAKYRRNTNVETQPATTISSAEKSNQMRKRVSSTTTTPSTTTTTSSSPVVTTLLWHDGPGLICTCMLYLTPTPNNIQLLYEWEQEIIQDTTGIYLSDQDAFMAYIDKTQWIPLSRQMTTYAVHPVTHTTSRPKEHPPPLNEHSTPVSTPSSYMTILYRNDREFPHGHKYNWYNITIVPTISTTTSSGKPKKNTDFLYHPNDAIIVHNNWIKGKMAKYERFQSAGLWNPSGLLL